MRAKVKQLVDSNIFSNFIIAVIIFNAITLGLETSSHLKANYTSTLSFLDQAAIIIFLAEIILRIYAYGFRFFKGGWNIFDFVIVGISLVPASAGFSVLRSLRILRVLRLISNVKSMKQVVESLFRAIPGISSVIFIIVILFYIFAVIGTKMFGADFPEWFGSLGKTIFTLFQIMTLESWSMGIVRPIMEAYPYAWIYFTTYILITAFTMVNLFIAVMVNAMQKEADDSDEDRQKMTEVIIKSQSDNTKILQGEIKKLNDRIDVLEGKK